jgi:hypothetical protein
MQSFNQMASSLKSFIHNEIAQCLTEVGIDNVTAGKVMEWIGERLEP